MNTVAIEDVPELLRGEKELYALVKRALELRGSHPVISYYCLFCALEGILAAQLHNSSSEMELFTVALLDETEGVKKTEDPVLSRVVHDRILLLTVVITFAYSIVNKCYETVRSYSADTIKANVVDQIRAALTFLSVVDYMLQDIEETADWAALGGAAVTTKAQFRAMNKRKSKSLKVQLMRVLKDEIGFEGRIEDEDLETELMNLKLEETDVDSFVPGPIVPGDFGRSRSPSDAYRLSNSNVGISDGTSHSIQSSVATTGSSKVSRQKLRNNQDKDPLEPEAHLRRDGDVSHLVNAAPVSVAILSDIADRAEVIKKIQKHAKFAVSALNYDDLTTAKRELTQSLEMLRLLESQE